MSPTIERSAGLPTGLGFVAGGGFSGASDDLDSLVQEAANALAQSYGKNVTIRFNSDRRSGGAWVVTDAVDGFGRNAEIGIGGYIVDARTTEARRKHEMEESPEGAYVTAHIGRRSLTNLEFANESGYYHGKHATIDEALAFVRANGSLAWMEPA